MRVYDVASVDNKGFSERYVTAPVSPLGQYTVVPSKFATAVALPTTMPVDPARRYRDAGMDVDPRKPYRLSRISPRNFRRIRNSGCTRSTAMPS